MSLKDYAAYIFDMDGTRFTIPVDWVEVSEELGKMVGTSIGNAPPFAQVEQLVSVRPSINQRCHLHEA